MAFVSSVFSFYQETDLKPTTVAADQLRQTMSQLELTQSSNLVDSLKEINSFVSIRM
jgi:hypothetical protein